MNNNEKVKENDTIKHIIRNNNNYDTAILNKVSRTKNEQAEKKKNAKKTVKFTYVGKN